MKFLENQIERFKTSGFLMIKPHSLGDTTYQIILDILQNESYELLNLSAEELELVRRLHLKQVIYRDLRDPRYEQVLHELYGESKDEKFYRPIVDEYTGEVIFVTFDFDGDYADMFKALKILKGKYRYDDASKSYGVRGILTRPSKYFSQDELNQMTGDDYVNAIQSIVRNYIHTPESVNEVDAVFRNILSNEDYQSAYL